MYHTLPPSEQPGWKAAKSRSILSTVKKITCPKTITALRQENYVQAREESLYVFQQSLKSSGTIKGYYKCQERAEKWAYLAHDNSTLSGPYLHLTSVLLTIHDNRTFFSLQNNILSKQNFCCNTPILAKCLQDKVTEKHFQLKWRKEEKHSRRAKCSPRLRAERFSGSA